MTLALYDRVQQTGTANTTVSFTLSGSVAGYQSFVAVGNGNTTYYGSFDTSGNWEVGLGTYSTTGPTLTRTTILSSSNGGLAVTFSGTVNVFITYPSEKSVNQDANGNVGIGNSSPTGKLDVSGFVRAIDYLPVPTAGTGVEMYYVPAGTQGYIGSYDRANALYKPLAINGSVLTFGYGTGAAEAMRIDSSGNVLVGVTSASYSASNRGVVNIGGSSGGLLSLISSTNKSYLIQSGADLLIENDTATGSITFGTNASTSRMVIDSSGNVGVGLAPTGAAKLEINSTGTQVNITDQTSTGNGNKTVTLAAFKSGVGYHNLQYTAYQHIWQAGGSATEAMRIDSGGNVGIGTSSVNNSAAGRTVLELNNSSNTLLNMSVAGTRQGGIYSDTSGVTFGSFANIPAIFSTNNTERMRIDSSGNLLVGLTSASGPGYNNANTGVQIAPDGTTYISKAGNITSVINNNGSGNLLTSFNYQGTLKGSISLVGTTAVAFNTTSDYRLKENVVPITGALAKVQALKPCSYTWKSAPDEIGEGFIAHELAEVCPQAVTGEKDAINEDGSIKAQSIDTSFLVATLTAAIQELNAKVTALEAQLSKP